MRGVAETVAGGGDTRAGRGDRAPVAGASAGAPRPRRRVRGLAARATVSVIPLGRQPWDRLGRPGRHPDKWPPCCPIPCASPLGDPVPGTTRTVADAAAVSRRTACTAALRGTGCVFCCCTTRRRASVASILGAPQPHVPPDPPHNINPLTTRLTSWAADQRRRSHACNERDRGSLFFPGPKLLHCYNLSIPHTSPPAGRLCTANGRTPTYSRSRCLARKLVAFINWLRRHPPSLPPFRRAARLLRPPSRRGCLTFKTDHP